MFEGNPILYQTEDWEGSNVAMGSVVKRGIGGGVVVPPIPVGAASEGGPGDSAPPSLTLPARSRLRP
eukprot:SAG31_NODE_4229_length_3440_cov_3.033224_3_plen_67_part_00